MNVYRRLGDQVGTDESRDLAERMAAWHDAMVRHVRVVGAERDARCADDCPHDDAARLWPTALDTFGEQARGLVFLRTHGQRSRPRAGGGPAGTGARL